jgi:thiol-disulfide isomerase/thioredoxin
MTRAVAIMDATDMAGRRWTSGDLHGRVILIDFWATWCAPCLADMPRLKALRESHAREDFEVLGVSLDVRSRHSLVSWLNRQRIDWPQIHEKSGYGGSVPRLFGIESLPRTVVIGRDGRIAAVDVRGERLASIIDTLVAGAPAAGDRK